MKHKIRTDTKEGHDEMYVRWTRERLYHKQHSEGRIENGEYDRCEQRVDPSELGIVDTGPNVGHGFFGFWIQRTSGLL
jgi:hypothetical protein